jgi:hypothetical protein
MSTCYGLAMVWALEHAAYDKELAVVFDSRPHRNQQNRAAFDAIERERERRKLNLANQVLPNEASNILNVDQRSLPLQNSGPYRQPICLRLNFTRMQTRLLEGSPMLLNETC